MRLREAVDPKPLSLLLSLIVAGPHAVRTMRRLLRGAAVGLACGLFICLGSVRPSQAQAPRFTADALRLRTASSLPPLPALRRPAAAHYDVVALRVEFQPDTSRFTTGDGTFGGDLFGGLQPKVDPLPHDADYFEAHLSFLEDYVRRASDGKTTVTTHLVPRVVRVSKPMGAYSPTGLDADADAERRKLASLIDEAWRLADAQPGLDLRGFDPARTVFVLFHAGVGRDIELLGTTLDKTPQDLPSLFFDQAVLRTLLGPSVGTLSYKGVPVTHSLLIPRTETRRAFDFIAREPFLLELSINGMLAASFFNYLGVPDLFDTRTGESAIGPFGLMDPLGIFAYFGLFPPEPMAWTKYYLGWAEPTVVATRTALTPVSLRAASLPGRNDQARVPVSDAEYFLVENRHRDPEGDGLVLRLWRDGQVHEQRIANGDETFNSRTIEGFAGGVVVGVDNYDWALPGGLDDKGNVLNGGLLVWHIDERRLREGLTRNRVNADPVRRAIDLEEADGAQDLGFPSNSPFGPDVHLGSPFDYFYKGNPVAVVDRFNRTLRLYQNRFGPDTHPSSATNAGGPSFVVLDDFSAPGAEMTFVYRQEPQGGVVPLANVSLGAAFGPGDALKGVPGWPRLLAYASEHPAPYLVAGDVTEVRPGAAPAMAAMPAVVAAADGTVWAELHQRPAAGGGPALALEMRTVGGQAAALEALPDQRLAGYRPAAPLWLTRAGNRYTARALLTNGSREAVAVLVADYDAARRAFTQVETDVAFAGERILAWAGVGEDRPARVTANTVLLPDGAARWSYALTEGEEIGHPAFGRDGSGLLGVLARPAAHELLFLLADEAVVRIDLRAYAPEVGTLTDPVLADLDGDGRLDVLVVYGASVLAFTQGGALVAGFPIRLDAVAVAQPLVARLAEGGGWSVVVAATDGYVYAFDPSAHGRLVEGFPLAAGRRLAATPLLRDGRLYAVSQDGTLHGWALAQAGAVWWGQHHGDGANSSYVGLLDAAPQADENELLDAGETYNWPNPVRDGVTYLRYRTSEDARLDVAIIDAAGGLVEAFTLDGVRGGVPGEYRWQTDAGSGLYLARVTATGTSGRTQTRIIRIAIIR